MDFNNVNLKATVNNRESPGIKVHLSSLHGETDLQYISDGLFVDSLHMHNFDYVLYT